MAIVENNYTGNGSTSVYSLSFPYLEESDVKVKLNGTLTTAYTFVNETTIAFTTPPSAGTAIRIYRDTNIDELAATFFGGSAIRATDLNDNFLQTNYSAQEVQARNLDPANAVFQANVNFNNYKGINLANGVNPNDAVNKSQLDASQNYNDAQLAASVASSQSFANVSQAAAYNASLYEASAHQAKTFAESFATAASNSANAASASASNAAASAATAAAFAGNTIFFGFSRNQNGNLILTWSSPAEATTYSTADYEYKGGSQWYIGSNDILYTSGPLLGQPKVSFSASGHLLLTA
jgi:hypothetical protein